MTPLTPLTPLTRPDPFNPPSNNNAASGLGTVASMMFWPAMSAARKTRKENIAIRLLEAPLSQSKTSDEAAKMLHRWFEIILYDKGESK